MMITAIRDPNPVIFLEAGALYGTKGEVEEGDNAIPFGKARVAARARTLRSSPTVGRSTCASGRPTPWRKRTA
jgi:hypothetical protein